MQKNANKKVMLSVVVDPAVRAAVTLAIRADDFNVSSFVNRALAKEFNIILDEAAGEIAQVEYFPV